MARRKSQMCIRDRQRQLLVTSGDVSVEGLLEQAQQLADFQLVIAEIPGANPNLLRHLIDRLRKQAAPIAVLLAAPGHGRDLAEIVTGSTKRVEKPIERIDPHERVAVDDPVTPVDHSVCYAVCLRIVLVEVDRFLSDHRRRFRVDNQTRHGLRARVDPKVVCHLFRPG